MRSSRYSWCSPPSTGFFLTRKEAETFYLSACHITGRPGAGSGPDRGSGEDVLVVVAGPLANEQSQVTASHRAVANPSTPRTGCR